MLIDLILIESKMVLNFRGVDMCATYAREMCEKAVYDANEGNEGTVCIRGVCKLLQDC